MAESSWLEKARAVRQEAYEALLASQPYAAFKAFDDAVVALGGSPLFETPDPSSSLRATASRVLDAVVKRAGEGRKLPQADAAEIALRQQREPMPIGRLMEAAIERGAEIGGNDPLNNFRSTMSKDKRFRPCRRNNMYFWWLTGEPLPPSWNEPEPDDLESLIGPGSSVSTNQEGGDGHAPATT
ncbi:hypothetical protein ACXY7D_03425 [Sphingomonas melonis]